MKKIDIHTHILPRELPRWKEKFGYGGFIELDHHRTGCARMLKDDGTLFREIGANCWDPHVRLKECDQAGVSVQVLSTVPVLFSYFAKPEHGYDVARFLNDDLARTVAAHPARFLGLGTLPMQSPKHAILEATRCRQSLGLSGVQIGTHIGGWNLDEPQVFEVLSALADLGLSVFVHPWDMMGADRMKRHWTPWLVGMPAELSMALCSVIMGGVLERLPKLRIAFAHGGGAFPGTLGRISHGFAARPDLCATQTEKSPESYLKRVTVDSLVHDERTLRFLIQVFGVDRIALGSDYPFPLGEERAGQMIERMDGLSLLERERLFSGTACEWLGIEA